VSKIYQNEGEWIPRPSLKLETKTDGNNRAMITSFELNAPALVRFDVSFTGSGCKLYVGIHYFPKPEDPSDVGTVFWASALE